jgi:hypothetical protein
MVPYSLARELASTCSSRDAGAAFIKRAFTYSERWASPKKIGRLTAHSLEQNFFIYTLSFISSRSSTEQQEQQQQSPQCIAVSRISNFRSLSFFLLFCSFIHPHYLASN